MYLVRERCTQTGNKLVPSLLIYLNDGILLIDNDFRFLPWAGAE